ncbi:hypothetical protein LJK87_02545 [Paenibacillus sp. P25]|nr:hypothetical protein LJK87_02545 [Paenibacillus sp. P25]
MPRTSGNLLLDDVLQADLTFVDPPPSSGDGGYLQEHMNEAGRQIREAGGIPYIIPEGGTDVWGTLGYVAAMQELGEQLERQAPGLKRVLVASAAGTCGTFAGLVTGALTTELPFQTDVVGISISGNTGIKRERTARLVRETLQLLGSTAAILPEQLWIEDRFIGPGYAVPTEAGKRRSGPLPNWKGFFWIRSIREKRWPPSCTLAAQASSANTTRLFSFIPADCPSCSITAPAARREKAAEALSILPMPLPS